VARRLVGRPARWQGTTGLVLGLAWCGLALSDPTDRWRWIVGALYLALSLFTFAVACSDYRNGRGRYSPPPPRPDD
jgi:hypothetical protein